MISSVLVGKCEHVIRRTTNSLYYITGGTCRRCKSAMTRWQLVCTASVVLFHRHGYWWLCLATHGISETSVMQRVHAFNERTQLLWCQFTRCHIVVHILSKLCVTAHVGSPIDSKVWKGSSDELQEGFGRCDKITLCNGAKHALNQFRAILKRFKLVFRPVIIIVNDTENNRLQLSG